MKIGILDSGVGGLTLLKECLKTMPQHHYLYYADALNAPYGTKTTEQVRALTEKGVQDLLALGAEMIVLACNTATSAAAATLRAAYEVPIIGMEPAVKPGIQSAKGKRVLVCATELTLAEEKFQQLVQNVDHDAQVDVCALTELVAFAEAGAWSEAPVRDYLQEKLSAYDWDIYGSVVLGCTHFPIFKSLFDDLTPEHVAIVDGHEGTIKHMAAFAQTTAVTDGQIDYFVSGRPLEAGDYANMIKNMMAIS